MDGLLLNTEDIYTIVISDVLSRYGKGPLTWDVKINLQGLTGDAAAVKIIETYDLPISPQEWININIETQKDFWPTCQFLPGAKELLLYLSENKIPFALATSSNTVNYQRKTGHLKDIFDLFGKHIITGDDPRVPKGRGKPCPDIYLAALKSLNDDLPEGIEPIKPEECLVFEDGLPGVKSGQNANAHVIWIPHPEGRALFNGKENELIGANGVVLNSMCEFDPVAYGLK